MEKVILEAMVKAGRAVIKDRWRSITKGKLFFPNAGLTASPDKRRATDVIFLDICEVFDSVLQNIFAS